MGEYSIRTEPLVTSGGLAVPHKAIIRNATDKGEAEKVLGVVGSEFQPIGPLALCSIFDEAVNQPVETIGALRDGAILFVTVKMPTFDVKGDEIQDYIIVNNPMDGGEAASIIRSPVRVVCMNTLRMGKARGTTQYRVIHDVNAQGRMHEWLQGLYQKSVAQAALLKEACEILAGRRVSQVEAVEVLGRVYPDPRPIRNTAPKDVLVKRAEHREYIRENRVVAREQALNLFNGKGTGMDTPAAAGTAWGLVNAVVEYEDCRWSRNAAGAIESSVFGTRADVKDVAFDECFALAGGKK
jgi:phage/plasmid-like protein (TIGR03299 family)